MNRRGFLGTMLALLGTTAIDPKSLLWTPDVRAVEILEPSALVTLDHITKALVEEIARLRGTVVPLDVNVLRVGDTCASGYTLTDHYSIDMATAPQQIDRYGLDYERYIKPIAQALHRRTSAMKACASLELPSTVDYASMVRHPKSGVAVRGISHVHYDPVTDDTRHILRFDMLVAQ